MDHEPPPMPAAMPAWSLGKTRAPTWRPMTMKPSPMNMAHRKNATTTCQEWNIVTNATGSARAESISSAQTGRGLSGTMRSENHPQK